MTPLLWQQIERSLRADLAGLPEGHRLPPEADLAARFGVNRHTVRRALAALAEAGLVHSRRGAGVFVAQAPTDYPLGRRMRLSESVAASGRTASRQVTRAEERPASPEEAEALRLDPGAPVHLVEGTSMADGLPLAAFRSVFPALRFPGLGQRIAVLGSITAALTEAGLPDYARRETRIVAKLADPVLAGRLQIAAGAPVLRTRSINVDAQGVPVELGTTWFAGDRVTLVSNPD